MNFGKRRSAEKIYSLENDVQTSACPSPIKAVGEHPMCHICASLCSLCEGKEGAKTIYVSLVFINYRNKNQHAADYLFGLNRHFYVGLRRLRRWNSETETF